jgi:hypothetical protein
MPPGPSASREQLPMPQNSSTQIATIEHQGSQNGAAGGAEQQAAGTSANISIPVVTCDFASDVSTSEAGAEIENELYKDRLRVDGMTSHDGKTRCHVAGDEVSMNNNNNNNNVSNSNGAATATNEGNSNDASSTTTTCKKLTSSPSGVGRCRALSVNVDTDAVSEFEPSSSDSGVVSRCAVVKPLKFRLCQPIFGKKQSKGKEHHHHNHHHHSHHHEAANKKAKNQKPKENCEIQPALPKVVKPRDPEKEKRRIARKKEKRATLILGLIMGR